MCCHFPFSVQLKKILFLDAENFISRWRLGGDLWADQFFCTHENIVITKPKIRLELFISSDADFQQVGQELIIRFIFEAKHANFL